MKLRFFQVISSILILLAFAAVLLEARGAEVCAFGGIAYAIMSLREERNIEDQRN